VEDPAIHPPPLLDSQYCQLSRERVVRPGSVFP
jgi:hypothetical protein